MFFKKDAQKISRQYALNTHTFLNFLFFYRDFSFVMEIWFKVLEKSWNFKMVISRPGKKNLNHRSFGKVMEICYHMFIYAEFEIINMFFKERCSKYKPAYALIRNIF